MENAKFFLFRFVTNKLVQIVLPYINRNTESFVLNNGGQAITSPLRGESGKDVPFPLIFSPFAQKY